jgi:hypothetical protein
LDIHPFHAHGGPLLGPWKRQWHIQCRRQRSEVPNRVCTGEKRYDRWMEGLEEITLQNPGTWVMHCHILAHMIMSLLSAFSSNFLETIAGVVTAEMQTAWMFGVQWTLSEQDAFPHSNPLSLVIWTAPPNLKLFWGNTQLSNGRLRKNLASASKWKHSYMFHKIGNAIAKAIHNDKANPYH